MLYWKKIQNFIEEEGEAEDNIHCMEDEVDYSFLTQAKYEEALIDEQITEEIVYQADGQEGYNLRSRLVAPFNFNKNLDRAGKTSIELARP